MPEPFEMPFAWRTRMGARNGVLDGIQIPMGRGNVEGRACPDTSDKTVP